MTTIVVTATPVQWVAAQQTGYYTRSTVDTDLTEVGFIHVTSPDQTAALLNRRFADRNDLLLLLVDAEKVHPAVKFEPALSGTPGLFPHIYGPLNVDAVYAAVTPAKDATGNYVLPLLNLRR